MVLTDGFLGVLGAPCAITVTGPGGSPATVPLHEILDMTPPSHKHKTVKNTPQSGTLSGKEQQLTGSEEAPDSGATVVYEKAHHLALIGMKAINGSTIVMTFSDGSTATGVGALSEVTIQPTRDTTQMTSKLSFALNAGWVFLPGS